MGIESFGGVALFRFHPLGGAPFPHLTLGYFGPSFCSGGSPPFGGDMNFGRFALWPTFLSYGNFPVAIFFAERKYVQPIFYPDNLIKIAIPRFKQISFKV